MKRPAIAFLISAAFLFTTSIISTSAHADLPGPIVDQAIVNDQTISNYLEKASQGYIQLNANFKQNPNVLFRVNEKRGIFESMNPNLTTNFLNSLTFNVEGFIQKTGVKDFLTAKTKYYSDLEFNPKKLSFEKKFFQPEEWSSLFFPPQQKLTLPLQAYDANFVSRDQLPKNSSYYSAAWHQQVDELTDTRLTFGNQVKILSNGESFQKKLELIRKSKKSIYIAVMTYLCDSSSREMLEALEQKSQEGVDIRMITEGLWSRLILPGCYRKLQRAGVEVISSNDLKKLGKGHAYFHNKFWIFDEKEGILGGQNILNSENLSTGFDHRNRDTDLYIKGPGVTEMMEAYIDLYDRYVNTKRRIRRHRGVEDLREAVETNLAQETKAGLRGVENYQARLSNPNTRDQGVCRFVIQGPQGDKHAISNAYIEYIKAAQQSLHFTTPEMNFDLNGNGNKMHTAFWNAVHERALAGVKLDVITNGIDGGQGELTSKLREVSDRWQMNGHPARARFLNHYLFKRSLKPAKKIRKYIQAIADYPNSRGWTFFEYYHGKTLDFDRQVVAVGSYNLDKPSAEMNHESTFICQDEGLAQAQDEILVRDLVNSTPVLKTQYASDDEEPALSEAEEANEEMALSQDLNEMNDEE